MHILLNALFISIEQRLLNTLLQPGLLQFKNIKLLLGKQGAIIENSEHHES